MLWVCRSGLAVGPAWVRFFGYAYGTCLGKILWAYLSGSAVAPVLVRFLGYAILAQQWDLPWQDSLGMQHIAFDSLIFV